MKPYYPLLAATAAIASLSPHGYAQSEERNVVATLEEIVVTANRRQEMLQDVPLSIAAFTSNFFEDAGVTDFKSLENYAASLKITPGTSSRETSIRIRGIGSTGTNSGIDPSVGVFIDNVYQGRAGMSLGDFLDIERVEVLRGPQGTLYGKNTAAGAISVITKAPVSEFEGTIETILGNYDAQEIRGMVNIPLNDSGSATRISGYTVERDGFDKNTVTGEDINTADRWGIKAKTLFETDEMGSFTVTIDKSEDNSECCSPDIISYDGISNLGITFADLAAATGTPLPEADPFDRRITADAPYTNEVEVQGVTVEWYKDLPNDYIVEWTNAYREYESYSQFDADFSLYDAAGVGSTDVEYEQTSSEFRITSPEGETIDWQLGLYYFNSKMDTVGQLGMSTAIQQAAVNTGSPLAGLAPGFIPYIAFADSNPQYALVENPLTPGTAWITNMIGPPPGFLTAGAPSFFGADGTVVNTDTNYHETTSYAIFGQATWNITDEFNATLGLRYGFEKKENDTSQVTSPVPSRDAPPFGPTYSSSDDRDVENVSPTITVRYFADAQIMYYATLSRGFKSGGFNQQRTAGGIEREFDDEESTNAEIGWKTTLMDGAMQFNGSVYYVDYQDFQAQTFDGTSIAVRNAGTLESYGVEMEMQYLVNSELMLGGSFGYNKSEYKEFDQAECTVTQLEELFNTVTADPTLWATNGGTALDVPAVNIVIPGVGTVPLPAGPGYLAPQFAGQVPCTQDLKDKAVDNAPEWTASTFLQYEDDVKFVNELTWFGRLEYVYTDEFYLATDLDENLLNDETHVVNARLGLRGIDGNWEVALWAKNLTDEEYFQAGLDVPTLSGYAGFNAPPRTYGASFRYNF